MVKQPDCESWVSLRLGETGTPTSMTSKPRSSESFHVFPIENELFVFILDLCKNPSPAVFSALHLALKRNYSGRLTGKEDISWFPSPFFRVLIDLNM